MCRQLTLIASDIVVSAYTIAAIEPCSDAKQLCEFEMDTNEQGRRPGQPWYAAGRRSARRKSQLRFAASQVTPLHGFYRTV